jgi:hypothetical protein
MNASPQLLPLALLVLFAHASTACSSSGNASTPENGAQDGGVQPRVDASGGDAGVPSTRDAGADGNSPDGSGAYGDEYGPWAGGAAYYAKFSKGLPSDPAFFPISVWLQDPGLASQYAAIGINTFVGLWDPPSASDLAAIGGAGVGVFVEPDKVTGALADHGAIDGWMHMDEPDNAQSDGTRTRWGRSSSTRSRSGMSPWRSARCERTSRTRRRASPSCSRRIGRERAGRASAL